MNRKIICPSGAALLLLFLSLPAPPRAMAGAAAGDVLISPPASAFLFPANVVGGTTTVTPVYRWHGGRHDLQFAVSGGTIRYEVHYFRSYGGAQYNSQATQSYLALATRLSVSHPAMLGEWVRLLQATAQTSGNTEAIVGGAYRNLVFVVAVVVHAPSDTAQAPSS